jgi:hypothetical protein
MIHWLATCLMSLAGVISADPRVLTELTAVSPDRPVALIAAGSEVGLELGDPAIVLRGDQLAASGHVLLTTPDRAAIRIDTRQLPLRPGDQVIVVAGNWLVYARHRLPAVIALAGRVSAVAPGARVGWMDLGDRHGVVRGDRFCVLREGVPLAVATVVAAQPASCLVSLRPVVANLTCRAGDAMRSISSPTRPQRGTVCYVVQAQPFRDLQQLRLAGDLEALQEPDTIVCLYRDGRYVGQATVESADPPLAQAITAAGQTREPIAPGDQGLAAGQAPSNEPLGYVFRIEEDYVLVSTRLPGEVKLGQHVYARRAGRLIAELVVRTVQQSFFGARLIDAQSMSGRAGLEQPISLWDEVCAESPDRWPRRWDDCRAEVWLDNELVWLTGPNPREGLAAGSLIALDADQRTIAVGLVLLNTNDRSLAWVPRCWQSRPVLSDMLLSVWAIEYDQPMGEE